MGSINNRKKQIAAGYEGAKRGPERKAWRIERRTEDDVLNSADRDRLVSACRDLRRNSSVVQWMTRTHVNNTCVQSFKAGNATRRLLPNNPQFQPLVDFYDQLEVLMKRWMRDCDVNGRFDFDEMVEMSEQLTATDGDNWLMKISGEKLQIIEGDRVRNLGSGKVTHKVTKFYDDGTPYEEDLEVDWSKFTHGVEITPAGTPQRIAICERSTANGEWKLKTLIAAQYMIHNANIEGRADQVRGIPKLASAVNDFTDLHESNGFMKQKIKLAARFAIKRKRGADFEGSEDDTALTLDDGTGVVDLMHDEDASFMESQSPADQWQNYYMKVIQAGLKAMNIPMSMYDEAYVNYSGGRSGQILYNQHTEHDRKRICKLRGKVTTWLIQAWIERKAVVLPEGMSIDDIEWEWISKAMPWVDPQRETRMREDMIRLGLTSAERVAREIGNDAYEIADEQKAYQLYINKLNGSAPGEVINEAA